jgi:hypothetical protein
MLSDFQRTKIRSDIAKIASDLRLTLLEERQIITEDVSDFPTVQLTFNTEGRRQQHWRAQLHEAQDPQTHEWQTTYGNISQSTASIQIKSLDVDELHTKSSLFAVALWKQACNWSLEHTSKIEWRGTDPPRYLPPYLFEADERHNIYTCNIDFFVDYEFSWPIIDLPITNFVVNSSLGIDDYKSLPELHAIAPGCYVMSGQVSGNNSAYKMNGFIN